MLIEFRSGSLLCHALCDCNNLSLVIEVMNTTSFYVFAMLFMNLTHNDDIIIIVT